MVLPQSTRLHGQHHETLEALNEALTQENEAVPRKMLRKSTENLYQYFDKDGRLLAHVIFST
jgi:hypothetical protein